jgi:hypothetical protein
MGQPQGAGNDPWTNTRLGKSRSQAIAQGGLFAGG